MTGFLVRLAGLTLGGGAAILLLLLLARLTGRRYGARWRCWIWLLLALRLAVPVPLLPNRPAQAAPIQLTAPRDPVIYHYAPPDSAGAAAPGQPPAATAPVQPVSTPAVPAVTAPAPGGASRPEAAEFSLTLGQVLFALWLAGGLGVLGWNGLSHLRFRRCCRPTTPWGMRWG